MAASDDTTAKARLADHAMSEGAKATAAALENNTKLGTDALAKLMELAKEGAWVFLLGVGALIYALAFGMEIHVWGVGTDTLSTGKFAAALGAAAFVLLLGAALRLYALHQIATIQRQTGQLQKEIGEATMRNLQEGAQDAIKELSRG
jgi:hypothetical protein